MSLVSCLFGYHEYKEIWRNPIRKQRGISSIHVCDCKRAHAFFTTYGPNEEEFLRHYILIKEDDDEIRLQFDNPTRSATLLPKLIVIDKRKNRVVSSLYGLKVGNWDK